jgi:hypothetical protein
MNRSLHHSTDLVCDDGRVGAQRRGRTAAGRREGAPTLFTQLGGYDALAAVTDDFVTALATDPTLSKSFTGLNDESKKRVRHHVIDSVQRYRRSVPLFAQDMKIGHIRTAHHRYRVEHVGTALSRHVEQVQGAAGAANSGDGSDQRAERRHRRAVRQLSVVSCQLAVVSMADAAGFLAT